MTQGKKKGSGSKPKKKGDYRILRLYAENIKRVKVIDITPDRNVVILEGKNREGKTSALDSIAYVLGGKSLIPKNPVSKGQETAKAVVDVGEFKVTRHWTTPEKSYLKIEQKEGGRITNPQKFLDDIIGNLAFDPLEFVSLEQNKRVEILKKITGLEKEIESIDTEYETTYLNRREHNKTFNKIKGELDNYGKLPDFGKVRPLAVIQKEYYAVTDHNRSIVRANEEIEVAKCNINDIDKKIKELTDNRIRYEGIVKKESETAKKRKKDEAVIKEELSRAEKHSDLQYKIKRKQELEKDHRSLDVKIKEMNDKLNELKESKKRMITSAKMPIKGLEIGETDVLYNGVEFSQASQAEQIEVSMSIAIAENPKIKIVRILNGSLLDKESLEKVKVIARKNDYQCWIERVADEKSGDGNAIFIEDGTNL